jgi:hypothetical protein
VPPTGLNRNRFNKIWVESSQITYVEEVWEGTNDLKAIGNLCSSDNLGII